MKIAKFRDLTLIDLNNNQTLVISCDSCGGIGTKQNDVVKASPDIVGHFTAQVVLAELVAIGAQPITIVNNLSVEMNDTGVMIIEGIKRAVKPLGLGDDVVITGSTEENFVVSQTAIGITAIGILEKNKWKKPHISQNSLAVVVGMPKVGENVLQDGGKQILNLDMLKQLRENVKIEDIIPVGSKGILYEAKEMARTNGVKFILNKKISLDINQSAGPATCAILAIDKEGYNEIRDKYSIPVNRIGYFI